MASKAKQAGINITLSGSNFNYMVTNYIDPAAPANVNKWADDGLRRRDASTPTPPRSAFFNTGGSGQIGDYSNPTADRLINASLTSGNPPAVKNELAFFDDEPAGAVPAVARPHLGLEDQRLGDPAASVGEPDPVLPPRRSSGT